VETAKNGTGNKKISRREIEMDVNIVDNRPAAVVKVTRVFSTQRRMSKSLFGRTLAVFDMDCVRAATLMPPILLGRPFSYNSLDFPPT
jgi:hypothetical protein